MLTWLAASYPGGHGLLFTGWGKEVIPVFIWTSREGNSCWKRKPKGRDKPFKQCWPTRLNGLTTMLACCTTWSAFEISAPILVKMLVCWYEHVQKQANIFTNIVANISMLVRFAHVRQHCYQHSNVRTHSRSPDLTTLLPKYFSFGLMLGSVLRRVVLKLSRDILLISLCDAVSSIKSSCTRFV